MIETGKISIYGAMVNIKEGKYAIPPFQREYVWSKEKIIKLWDSILMGYPISTFLFWKFDREISSSSKLLRFTYSAKFRTATNGKTLAEAKLSASPNNIDEAVLDGQQRLTSLYVSLIGCCSLLVPHEPAVNPGVPIDLYIGLTNNAVEENDVDGFESVKTFNLKFSARRLGNTFFKIRDVLSDRFKNPETRSTEIETVLSSLADENKEYARNVLNTLCDKIYKEEIIQYQNVEGEESEALEMFIRFNNGGKPLTKTDIADATITYYWNDAPEKFLSVVKYKGNLDRVENRLIKYKDFGLNFIIRLGIMIFEENVASSIGRTVINGLKNNWDKIKNALAETASFLGTIGINIESYKSRWNVLLPVIYFVYSNDNYRHYQSAILAYLSRSTLLKYYQNGTTAKLTKIKKLMNENQFQGKPVLDISVLDKISELKVTEPKIDEILECKKGSPIAKIALEWLNFTLSSIIPNDPHEDHLQPRSLFGYAKPPEVSDEDWMNWKGLYNMLPNLQFFDGELNKFKSNHELYDFYDGLDDGENGKIAYQKKYLLFDINSEEDEELLLLKNFGKFFEKRKAVIKEKLSSLLGFAEPEEDAE